MDQEMIASPLREFYPLNPEQEAIVSHKQGPLRVIAGPGSGKTYSLTLLAMNLLLCNNAQPDEIILCTYTEKAAHEMQDRIYHIAQKIHYIKDLSPLRIGTIHSLCNQMITQYLHHTPLGNNYHTLDNFTQRFLIYKNLSRICTTTIHYLLEEWGSAWDVTKKLQFFFDKITEELVFPVLKNKYPYIQKQPSNDETLACILTHAYHRYQKILEETNSVDFAHLQKCAYNLLQKPDTFQAITKNIRYVLVDEYQDTNYIQEQILNQLVSKTQSHNLCVVGDEDQALYRFRGATVRNILEFEQAHPDCKKVQLSKNYRSHPQIIDLYTRWMEEIDWSHPQHKSPFRIKKTTFSPAESDESATYPAVLTLNAQDIYQEATLIASLIAHLKQQGQIQDYSQVAILLYSVRAQISDPYITALKELGIPAYCPRARNFFQCEEIKLLMGCLARLLCYRPIKTEDLPEQTLLDNYLKTCLELAKQTSIDTPELEHELITMETDLLLQEQDEQGTIHIIDYFYRLTFTEPFKTRLKEKEALNNLVLFSQLLTTFQQCYPPTQGTLRPDIEQLERDFLHTFLCLLHEDGINQFEDPQEPFPSGHVQILTIHQAKGIEFPVVITGRLDKLSYPSTVKDKILRSHYHQQPEEPEERIPGFDVRRLYYVAFSRAKRLLILTSKRQPDKQLTTLWSPLPTLYTVPGDLQYMPPINEMHDYLPPKRRFSFTNHIHIYEICPRRFEFLREYRFQTTNQTELFYGQLIHQTLEAIHRFALERNFSQLQQKRLHHLFEKTYKFLSLTSIHPLDLQKKEEALQHIFNYVDQNWSELHQINDVELGVQVEKQDYILTGKVDLLLKTREGLEVIDFKTGFRPQDNAEVLSLYKKQLYLYAHAVEKRMGQLPARLFIYWTSEPDKEKARLELSCQPEQIKKADLYFDSVIKKIQRQQFTIETAPSPSICRNCDIRYLCKKENIISL